MRILYKILLASLFVSCSNLSQSEKELKKIIGKTLEINMFDIVQHKDTNYSVKFIRESHEFLSVVYLQDGCTPCYPKFIEWHQKMDSLNITANHAVLFVIQGSNYSEFMRKVFIVDSNIVSKHYTIMDPFFEFSINNENIPRWIIDASVLIDAENKIQMVGAPWLNEDMKKLFYKTVKNEQ